MSTKKLQIVGNIGIDLDSSLTQSGVAADAKATGDAIDSSLANAKAYTDAAIAENQGDTITGTEGQFVVIGADGKPVAKTIPWAEDGEF